MVTELPVVLVERANFQMPRSVEAPARKAPDDDYHRSNANDNIKRTAAQYDSQHKCTDNEYEKSKVDWNYLFSEGLLKAGTTMKRNSPKRVEDHQKFRR